MKTAIWWIRRDLRLRDNKALAHAARQARGIIPVFVLDPAILASPNSGDRRVAFLFGGLRVLDEQLRALGSRLVVRRGNPADELGKVLEESGADFIVAEEDYSPYARRRDQSVGNRLPLQLVPGVSIFHPELLLKDDGEPYVVFTPFSRRWKALMPPTGDELLEPRRFAAAEKLSSTGIPPEPGLPAGNLFPPGEPEALERLEAFTGGRDAPIYRYAQSRDRPDLDLTSRLSPYLRFGMVSARHSAVAAYEAIDHAPDDIAASGAAAWLNELIWRDFYLYILFHFPEVSRASFRSEFDRINWDNNGSHFAAWCQGNTGFPIVDAAMRQLTATGWMHNRTRMIVASFLVKHLLIDWRWGEKYFMQHLLDGDVASNNGGWQWSAGTGTDAAPYFRVFNPVLQSKKFDPHGAYIRRWLPECARVPRKFIHEPWKMPVEVQREASCLIGTDYPAPIIDLAFGRERALAAYRRAGEGS